MSAVLNPRTHAKRPGKIRSYTADAFDLTTNVEGRVFVTLAMRRGRYERLIDKRTGEMVGERRDETAEMRMNIGDRVVVLGPELAHVAVVVIAQVEIVRFHDRMRARLLTGTLPSDAARVHVLPAHRLGGKRAA